MAENNMYARRAVTYSLLAHIKDSGQLTNGPLYIFIPLVKNVLHKQGANKRDCKGANITEICDAFQEQYGITIPNPVMLAVLRLIAKEVNEKAQNDNQEMTIYNDGSFWIKSYLFDDYQEEIERSRSEVEQIKTIYSEFCRVIGNEDGNDENAIFHFIEQNREDISYYLSHEESTKHQGNVVAAKFVEMFKIKPEIYGKLRDMYLGSILTSYLEYQPQNVNMGVELVLDTNFIISLLDLNTPESTRTCNCLIDVCKNLGYRFTVLQATIEEAQDLLAYKSENLNKALIARTVNREDIYNACDRRNLSSVDLDRISDNLQNVMKDYGFDIKNLSSTLINKAKYSKEYEALLRVRSREKAALHDAMAVMYVKERRGKRIKDFEKCPCWFVNNSICHDSESNTSYLAELKADNEELPEIIKVDDLLNILWLSNPKIDISKDQIIDMGLTSLISDTLISSLPKARIIKELDDNIQKYRKDYNLTDKDVINLSTRIADRQIKDIESFNRLAERDAKAFADRVKEESQKEESYKQTIMEKVESVVRETDNLIARYKEDKEEREKEYQARIAKLEFIENRLKEESENKLKLVYGKYKGEKERERELYVNKKIKRRKRILIISSAVLFLLIVILVISCIKSEKLTPLIGVIISIIMGCFAMSNISRFNDPVYVESYKKTIKIPKELQIKTYEKFLSEEE